MAVTLTEIVMDYPGTRALDHVSAAFRFDEVHGLIGENGAGKSTFVNVLGGSLRPTAGRIALEGCDVSFDSPRAALEHGIAHVSQEGSLVPTLDGAENILLGAEPRFAAGILKRKDLYRSAHALVERWFPGLVLTLDRPVIDLPMADRKVVEIVRALRGNIRLLILDEPTATLEAREKKQLWQIIRSLPKSGVGVVLISHFLSEIRELSDRITVLRDGALVGTMEAASTSENLLADLMLRREGFGGKSETAKGTVAALVQKETVLSVRDWRVADIEVDAFDLQAGEIVGMIGLTGAGHFGFARSLYTRQGLAGGTIAVTDVPVTSRGVRAMQRAGVAFVPDQRMEYALSGEGSVVENMTMVHPDFATQGGILRRRRERAETSRVIDLLNIKTPGQGQLIKNLSGGNKQKVSIGKWLYGAGDRYRVLIFIEPTEGVDIGTKREIHAHMHRLAAGGAGIVIASSDLGEIAQVCHRAIPFVHGRIGEAIGAEDFSEGRFIAAISGEAA